MGHWGTCPSSTSNWLTFWSLQSHTNPESLTLDSVWLLTQKNIYRPMALSPFIAWVSSAVSLKKLLSQSFVQSCSSSREILATPLYRILHAVWSAIGIILSVVRLSVCLWCCASWLNDSLHPSAKVSEQVNRNCFHRNTIWELSSPNTNSIPSNFPPLERWTIDVGAVWRIS